MGIMCVGIRTLFDDRLGVDERIDYLGQSLAGPACACFAADLATWGRLPLLKGHFDQMGEVLLKLDVSDI